MVTFLLCLALLVAAYFTYGRYLERLAGADARSETPCRRLYDGVDYVPLPRWRIFLIQLLNIAGTGPIFGAILGACFGPVAFLWITFGGIFMGAMHDYLSGMMLVRNDGLSIPEVVGRYLGGGMRQFMRIFSVLLLVLVGAVFLLSPAQLLANIVPAVSLPCVGVDHPGLLFRRHAAAHRQDHRQGLSRFRRGAGRHGSGTSRGAAFRRLPHSRDDHLRQFPARRLVRADRSDALHHHRLRRDFGLPRHAVAAHGPLRGQRTRMPVGLLRGDDLRSRSSR